MKLIKMPHQINDYTCSINGLVDMYQWKTGTRLPDDLFYYISHLGFTYYQNDQGQPPGRMMFWSSGLGEKQYSFLAPILGYKLHSSEGLPTEEAWMQAVWFVDNNNPVILAGLDMYHLPYLEKFYHSQHVPGHYVLLVGYDETQGLAFVQDTSRAGIQSVPYRDLYQAWNVEHIGQSLKNTLYAIEWPGRLPQIKEVICTGIQQRADFTLNPPQESLGIPALRKAARDLPVWLECTDNHISRPFLEQFVTYTASVVPLLPEKLLPYPLNYVDRHQGSRDKFALLLVELASEYGGANWQRAGRLFQESGSQIELMTDMLVGYIAGSPIRGEQIGSILNVIADIEEEAFRCLCPA